jgi:hypothetical protein
MCEEAALVEFEELSWHLSDGMKKSTEHTRRFGIWAEILKKRLPNS